MIGEERTQLRSLLPLCHLPQWEGWRWDRGELAPGCACTHPGHAVHLHCASPAAALRTQSPRSELQPSAHLWYQAGSVSSSLLHHHPHLGAPQSTKLPKSLHSAAPDEMTTAQCCATLCCAMKLEPQCSMKLCNTNSRNAATRAPESCHDTC